MGWREISQAEDRQDHYWYLFRTVAIDGLKDLMAHLKTATPFEYMILGEPIADTPHQGETTTGGKEQRRARITIRGVPRPYLICDCDSLPNLEGVDVSKLTPAQIHRYAVADLPQGIPGSRLRDVLLGLARHQPRQSEGAPVVLAFEADRQRAPQALARSDQRPRRARADRRQPRRRSVVGTFFQPIYCAAPAFRGAGDPVPERWHFIAGTTRDVPVPAVEDAGENLHKGKQRRHDPGSGGAGGATGGWRGILEHMGGNGPRLP